MYRGSSESRDGLGTRFELIERERSRVVRGCRRGTCGDFVSVDDLKRKQSPVFRIVLDAGDELREDDVDLIHTVLSGFGIEALQQGLTDFPSVLRSRQSRRMPVQAWSIARSRKV